MQVVIGEYKKKLELLRSEVKKWNREGVGGFFQVSWYTSKVDEVVRSLFFHIYGRKPPPFSLVALGGYGRKELNLASDIDLLFLYSDTPREVDEESISSFVRAMWDIGFEFSCSYRGVEETLEFAEKDQTLKLSLLDARLIGGSYIPYFFLKRLMTKYFTTDPKRVIEMLEAWIDERYRLYGTSIQLIEPNVKESPGTLRDIHTVYWIGKLLYQIEEFRELEKKGLLTILEFETLSKARDFIWRVRNAIHSIKGKKNDFLDLSVQPEVADILGYRSVDKFSPSVYMMKDFYNHVISVRKVMKAFITRVKEEFRIEPASGVRDFVKYLYEERFESPAKFLKRIYKGLELNVDFERIYRGFWVPPLYWRESDVYSEATREALIDILNFPKAYPAIRFLHETGFLSRLFPEFDRITGLVQLDLYHKYTVDEHTLLSIKAFESLAVDTPVLGELLVTFFKEFMPTKYLIMLALLFHDLGKGKGRGHSVRSMKLAIRYMEKMGFSEQDIALVSFLVRYHTTMAEYAFKRNIYDTGTLASFVDLVGSIERLKMLYLVTYSDISAVAPGNWDDWKAMALYELFVRAKDMLEGKRGLDVIGSLEDTYRDVLRLMMFDKYDESKVKFLWDLLPWDKGIRLVPNIIAVILKGIDRVLTSRELFAQVVDSAYDGTYRLIVVKPYGIGDFYKVVGAISANGIDIWGANLIECKQNISVYVFELSNMKEGFLENFMKMLDKTEQIEKEVKRVSSRYYRRTVPVDIPTQVTLNNSISPEYSLIEIKTRDRIGLLYDISRVLANCEVEIHFVKAVTEGRRAIDTFYVTKNGIKISDKDFLKISKALKHVLG